MNTYPEKVTASGAIFAANEKGVYAVVRCGWLVRIPSGNPEPDSFEDTYRDVECGQVMRYVNEARSTCDHGHSFGYSAESAADWAMLETCRGDEFDPWMSLAHVA